MSDVSSPELAGFEAVRHPGALILCRPEATSWVRYVLEGGQGLYAAAARDREARSLEGRETVYVIPAKSPSNSGESGARGEDDRWVVRHYVRGGRVLPWLLGDRYLRWGHKRPFQEVRASESARAREVPTPRVVAAAVYPTRFFYRADIVTEYVPGSSDLIAALFDDRRMGAGGALERRDALQATGELIRTMAKRGVVHRDLHAGNILLQWRGAAPSPYLLDLDRCWISPSGRGVSPAPMVRRLSRSLRKWEKWSGLRITEREWDRLREMASA